MEQNESDHRIMYWSIKCTGQPWVWSKCQASEAIMNIGHIFLVWFICETRQKDIAEMKNKLLRIWSTILFLNFKELRICRSHFQISFSNLYYQKTFFTIYLSISCMISDSNLIFFDIENTSFKSIKMYKVQTWMMFG